MKTFMLMGPSGARREINDTDLRYLRELTRKDLRYQRTRSASHKARRGDWDANKIRARQQLFDKLDALLEGRTT